MRAGRVIERTPDGGELRKHINRRAELRYYAFQAGSTVGVMAMSLWEARKILGIDTTPKKGALLPI